MPYSMSIKQSGADFHTCPWPNCDLSLILVEDFQSCDENVIWKRIGDFVRPFYEADAFLAEKVLFIADIFKIMHSIEPVAIEVVYLDLAAVDIYQAEGRRSYDAVVFKPPAHSLDHNCFPCSEWSDKTDYGSRR